MMFAGAGSEVAAGAGPIAADDRITRYAYWALAVLILVNTLNVLDRTIVSILAQGIKADLKLDDAQLGFLLGTGFAVFYSVIGIAMGRIADVVSRRRLMALGLLIWSGMTALGAGATGFAGLAGARIGVGIGEATANPVSNSLLSDFFPPRNRAAALGAYVSGSFLGGALALIVGGLILQHWSTTCSIVPGGVACGLRGWQAALIVVGLPGVPLALIVTRLREPERPGRETMALVPLLVRELSAALPPFTLVSLHRAKRPHVFRANLLLLAGLGLLAFVLAAATGDKAQWWAIGLGAYCVVTWGQIQKLRDPAFYRLTFGCPTFVVTMLSGALIACTTGAVNAWAAPYAMRVLKMPPAIAGASLGLAFALCAGLGVVVAGLAVDRWKRRDPRAPIGMAALSLALSLPALALMLHATTARGYVIAYGLFAICTSGWAGGYAALIQDLVLPRMRGSASSAFVLVNVVISAGGGPYWVGKVSAVTGSLPLGLVSVQSLAPFAFVLLLVAARRLPRETPAGRRQRADAAGELVRDAQMRAAILT